MQRALGLQRVNPELLLPSVPLLGMFGLTINALIGACVEPFRREMRGLPDGVKLASPLDWVPLRILTESYAQQGLSLLIMLPPGV